MTGHKLAFVNIKGRAFELFASVPYSLRCNTVSTKSRSTFNLSMSAK